MRASIAIVSVVALSLLCVFLAVSTRLPTDAAAAGVAPATKTCPYLVPSGRVKMGIARIVYTDEVQGIDGNRMRLSQEKKKHFRLAVVTIRVRKPAGMRLTLAAADLTIHYYHGAQADVTPCEGISTFNSSLAADRPMKLATVQGPGWVRQTTGARSTQNSEVYIDAVFAMMEPDTRECWICVGRPTATEPFVSQGWPKSAE